MNPNNRLDRDLIPEIFVQFIHAKMRPPERHETIKAEYFQLALASRSWYTGFKEVLHEEFRSIRVWYDEPGRFHFAINQSRSLLHGLSIPEFVFWRVNDCHFRELTFGDSFLDNLMEFNVLLGKLVGYGLEKIEFFYWPEYYQFDEICIHILYLISEAGRRLKELIKIPARLLCYLSPDLKLRNLRTTINFSLKELAARYDVEKFLNVSTQLLEIYSLEACLICTPWLKNVKATTLHFFMSRPVFKFSLTDQATNSSIKKIQLVLRYDFQFPRFDFTTLLSNLQKCYPQTVALEMVIKIGCDMNELPLAKKFINEIEARTDELISFQLDTFRLEINFEPPYYYNNEEFDQLMEQASLNGFARSELRSPGTRYIGEGWTKKIKFGSDKSIAFTFFGLP